MDKVLLIAVLWTYVAFLVAPDATLVDYPEVRVAVDLMLDP